MSSIIVPVQPPFTVARCEIAVSQDWFDPLPRFLEGGEPLNLTGKTIEIFIRPTYDHSILIMKLTTANQSIVIDDAPGGLASIRVSREVVAATLPLLPNGEAATYDHFCVLTEPFANSPTGFLRRELFRGPMVVRPGRTTG